MGLQAHVFCGCYEHGRVKHPLPDPEIVGVYANGVVTIATCRLTWNEGIGGILWDGRMLKQSRKSWNGLHSWAGRPPLP